MNSIMNNIRKIRETSDGLALYAGDEKGPRGGNTTWYAEGPTTGLARHALWCRTQKGAKGST